MSLLNDSGLGVLWNVQRWPPYRMAASCMVTVRCRLVDGGVCEIIDEQIKPRGAEYVDEDPTLAPLRPSHFGGIKPLVDVIVSGSCQLPQPVREAQVVCALGDWSKTLVVSGPRRWEKKLLSWKMTQAQPFDTCALDARGAFGGVGLPQNPWGVGYGNNEIPQIEYPRHRLRTRGKAIPPAGLSPVHIGHPRRVAECGTFDDAWADELWPMMPRDFQAAAANEAPLDQQLEHVAGDEELYLKNIIAGCPEMRTHLPSIQPRWFYAAAGTLDGTADATEQVTELALMLDTITIDGEAGYVDMLWRGMLPVRDEEEAPSIEHYVVCEKESTRTQREHVDAWQEKRVQDSEILERRAGVVAAALGQMSEVTLDVATGALPWDRARVEAVLADTQDLSGVNLAGLDLSGCDLSDAILTGCNLEGADLSGCNMRRAVLTHAQCAGACLRSADLTEADAQCAVFTTADLTGAILEGVDASLADLSGARADNMQAANAIFFGSRAMNMQAQAAVLTGADVSEAQWDYVDLCGAQLDHAQAYSWTAQHARLRGASLAFFGGKSSNLAHADMSAADVHDSTWVGACLQQVQLTAANARAANFTGVDASGLQASSIDARRAVFHRADLADADFSDGDLQAADAWGATLTGMNISSANVYELCVHECVDIPPQLRRAP